MEIFEKIEEYLTKHGMVNVVIAGSTCSGKTTLAQKIQDHFSGKYKVTIVSQDNFFKDLPYIPCIKEGPLFDSIDAFCIDEFKQSVAKLLENGVATIPIYDISSNMRTSRRKIVRTGQINVFEGLHTISLLQDLRNSISIYVDTDQNVCLERRISRDTSKYGIPKKRVIEFWNNCIMPMSKMYVFPQRRIADIRV